MTTSLRRSRTRRFLRLFGTRHDASANTNRTPSHAILNASPVTPPPPAPAPPAPPARRAAPAPAPPTNATHLHDLSQGPQALQTLTAKLETLAAAANNNNNNNNTDTTIITASSSQDPVRRHSSISSFSSSTDLSPPRHTPKSIWTGGLSASDMRRLSRRSLSFSAPRAALRRRHLMLRPHHHHQQQQQQREGEGGGKARPPDTRLGGADGEGLQRMLCKLHKENVRLRGQLSHLETCLSEERVSRLNLEYQHSQAVLTIRQFSRAASAKDVVLLAADVDDIDDLHHQHHQPPQRSHPHTLPNQWPPQ